MMKTLLSFRQLVMVVVLLIPGWSLLAQQNQNQGDVKVTIEKKENGETVLIEETLPASPQGTSIDAILQQYGVDTEFGNLAPGEEVEIIIRRKTGDATTQDLTAVIAPQSAPAMVLPQPEDLVESKPFLGVYYENGISELRAQLLGIEDRSVAYVTSVISNTGADEAKLQKGDVITAIDGEQIRPGVDLRDLIMAHKGGDKVTVHYIREGKSKKVKATLGEKKEVRKVWFDDNDDRAYIHSPKAVSGGPFLGISGTAGDEAVIVNKVFEGTAAQQMGLQEGDVIRSVNGHPVSNWKEFVAEIGQMKAGDALNLELLRNDTPLKLEGKVGAKPQTAAAPQARSQSVLRKEIRVFMKMEDVTPAEAQALSQGQEGGIRAENNLQATNLSFYPNPNDGRFNLTFNLPEDGNTQIRVYDLNGVTVYEEELLGFSGFYQGNIDISNFSKGIYFLQIEQNGRSLNKKIVTQ